MGVSFCTHDRTSLDALGSHIKILIIVTLEGRDHADCNNISSDSTFGEFNGCEDSTDESHVEYCSTCITLSTLLTPNSSNNLFTCTYMYYQPR